jgi:DNA-binding IscR family transcriptional regulator
MTLGHILRAIDGPIAPLPCISRTAYRRCSDCPDEKTCVVRRLFADTYAAQLLLMDSTTLADGLGKTAGAAVDSKTIPVAAIG